MLLREDWGEIPKAQGTVQGEHQPLLPMESKLGEHSPPNLGTGEQESDTGELLPPPITTTTLDAGEDGDWGCDIAATNLAIYNGEKWTQQKSVDILLALRRAAVHGSQLDSGGKEEF